MSIETSAESPEKQATTEPQPPQPPQERSGVSMTSEQLKARLNEERDKGAKSFLKELGLESKEDAIAIISYAKKRQDEEKTELEKRDALINELKPKAERYESIRTRYEARVNAEFDALPETARQAIDEQAKGNAEERERFMQMFAKAGILKSAPTQNDGEHAGKGQPAAPPAPRNTTNAAPPPRPSAAPSAWEQYQALLSKSPVRAQLFYAANQFAIDQARPASEG